MGLKEKIKKLLGLKAPDEALQSAPKRFNSASKRSNQRFKALQSAEDSTDYGKKQTDEYTDKGVSGFTKLSRPVELQRESLQLGVAAGYTGKSIKEIETSLARIESQMTSRDWFMSNFEDRTPAVLGILSDIKNALEKHDLSASKRFESIESALNRMMTTAKTAPAPIRDEIVKEIESIRSTLPLTPKMRQLVEIVKEAGKISYEDLGRKLSVTRSSLRGLLSNTMRRTEEIERYSVGGKGWVRYKQPKTAENPNFL